MEEYMSKKGKIALAAAAFLLLAVITGAFISLGSGANENSASGTDVTGSASGDGNGNAAGADTANSTVTEILTEAEDVDSYEWDETAATTFISLGDEINVDGSGVKLSGSDIIIEDSGQYEITGTLADGRIVIDAKNETVCIRLNNANISCSYSSAIYGYKADKLTIVLKDGTENSMEDAADYSFSDDWSTEAEEEPNACLYAKMDLLLCGTGSLSVTGNREQGITCNDIFEIADVTLQINSAGKALLGKDKLVVSDADITAEAGDDALHSNGNVLLNGGTYMLAAGDDGIHADAGVVADHVSMTITESNEGIEGWQIYLIDSDITIDSEDDAVNATSDATDEMDFGGNFGNDEFGNRDFDGGGLRSGNKDGENFDGGMTVPDMGDSETLPDMGDGGMTVPDTEFGDGQTPPDMEDGKMTVPGDFSESDGSGEQTDSLTEETEILLTIKNTNLYINAGGDGIDSNGSVYMDGGLVVVYGPANSGNGGLDYNNEFEMVSGTLLVMDMSGMAMQPNICSLPGIDVTLSQNLTAGEAVCVTSENYSYCFVILKNCNHFTLITPDMTEGDEVTVLTGGSCDEDLVEPLVKDAVYGGGSEAAVLTLESGITTYGSSGMGGGFGGGMNGGMGGFGGGRR